MIKLYRCRLVILLIILSVIQGCSAVKTFPSTVRAGETTAIAAGWKQSFSKENITVTLTPSIGPPIVLLPGDPAIRAVVNLYPDPVSAIVVSSEIKHDITPFAQTYADQINFNFTNNDKDWWQTTIFIDLPIDLPIGIASINISSSSGETYATSIEIIGGLGEPNGLAADLNGPLFPNQLKSLERTNYHVVKFSSSVIPYAIQADFTHDADISIGGTGKAYVVNPRGDIKSTIWRDDGINLSIILTPTWTKSFESMNDYKIYIAGGVSGLALHNIKAVDSAGGNVMGVSVTIESH